MTSPFGDYKAEIISALVAFGVLIAFYVGRLSKEITYIDTPSLAVRSNTAVEYFRVGVVIGATVERAKPGLTPQLLLPTALQYYGSLGPDPLLIIPQKESEVNLGKAAGVLSKMKPPKTNQTPANTNAILAVLTNGPPITNSPTEHAP